MTSAERRSVHSLGTQDESSMTRPASSAIPGVLQSDRATVQRDRMMMKSIRARLAAEVAAGNAAAAAVLRTELRIIRIKFAQDLATLRQDARPIFRMDEALLVRALKQLHTHQLAGEDEAVQQDSVVIAAAELKLDTDRRMVLGGLRS